MNVEEWELTEERITDFEFRAVKIFNMVINNEMFEQLEEIVGAKKVKDFISVIFDRTIPILSKVGTDLKFWKMFQHLIPQEDDPETKKSKKINNLMKNGKKRKHYHHFVQIEMFRNNYYSLLELHHKLNTFSMALIIRMMVLVFLDLYHKNGGDKQKALNTMICTIEKILKGEIDAEINFILLRENLKGTNQWRAVAFFQVEIYYKGNKKPQYFYRKRL